MTLGELIKGALKTDLYELLIWGEWYFRPSRVACKHCIEEKSIKGKVPDCVKCGQPSARLIDKTFRKKKEKRNV